MGSIILLLKWNNSHFDIFYFLTSAKQQGSCTYKGICKNAFLATDFEVVLSLSLISLNPLSPYKFIFSMDPNPRFLIQTFLIHTFLKRILKFCWGCFSQWYSYRRNSYKRKSVCINNHEHKRLRQNIYKNISPFKQLHLSHEGCSISKQAKHSVMIFIRWLLILNIRYVFITTTLPQLKSLKKIEKTARTSILNDL